MTDVEQLREALKPQLSLVPTGRTDEPNLSPKQAKDGLLLGNRATRLIRAKETTGEDRSARLFELASLLRDAGASEAETFVLLKSSVWNKFKDRDDEVERLWEAVERSRNGATSEPRLRNSNGHARRHSATSISTLLARPGRAAEWSVEKCWGYQQYGFVAGEPKTYKSTLTTDLAVSLASGSPFLDHFEVVKSGAVLIVQEENTEEIQHARFRRILEARELTGKFHSFKSGVLEFTPPANIPVYSFDRTGFTFTSKRKRLAIERELKQAPFQLLIIDPLQMVMGDLSLRDERDVAVALRWLNYIQKTYRVGVLCVHHYHKRREEGPQLGGQRMLGSQALHAWLMCGLYIQRVHGQRLKVNREFRAFPEHEPFELEFESEDDEDFYRTTVHETKRTPKQDELLDLVLGDPWKTATEYAKTLGKARSTVIERLDRLELRKKKRKGGDKGGRPVVLYGPPRQNLE